MIKSGEIYWYFPTQENAVLLRSANTPPDKNILNGDVLAASYNETAKSIFSITRYIVSFKDFYPGPKFWSYNKERYLIKDIFMRAVD